MTLIATYTEIEHLVDMQAAGHAIDENHLAALREKLGVENKAEDQEYNYWVVIAQENGISRNLFNERVRRCGWAMKKAATDVSQRKIKRNSFTPEEDAIILQGRADGWSYSEISQWIGGNRDAKSLSNRYQAIKGRKMQ